MKQTTILILLSSIIVCGVVVFSLFGGPVHAQPTVRMPTFSTPIATPLPKPEATPWVSPDGSKTLIMRTTTDTNRQKTYSFFVREAPSSGEHLVFSKTEATGNAIAIPFNSWSPNNQYFFLQEKGSTGEHILVFKASGEVFPDGGVFIDVNTAFVEKKVPYAFSEVTGWAAPTLLVVNTKSPTSSAPISFWFDISKKSFIRLSTSFQ